MVKKTQSKIGGADAPVFVPKKVPSKKGKTLLQEARENNRLNNRFRRVQPDVKLIDLQATDALSIARSPEILCSLNVESFSRVINALAQCAQTILGSTIINDQASSDLENFVQAVAIDLGGAMNGAGTSLFAEMPLFYRELWEALQPKTMTGRFQATFRFNPSTIPSGFTPIDNVQWGVVSSASPSVGLFPILAFNPSSSQATLINSANTIWQRFNAYGHAMWRTGNKPTSFFRDASAYAWPTYDAQPDFVSGSGVLNLEVPIVHLWLAALQLVDSTVISSRVSNYSMPFYAPPQSYMGFRVNSFNTGKRGRLDQVRLQFLNIAELATIAWGVMLGVNNQAASSTAVVLGEVPYVAGAPNYYDLFEVMLRYVAAQAFFNESGVTVGATDAYGNLFPLPWGNQFLAPSPSQSSNVPFFELVVENLRRLKYVGQKFRGVPTYVFNVPCSDLSDQAYKIFTARQTNANFSWLTMYNSGSSTFYNYNINGSGEATTTTYSGYVTTWKNQQNTASQFTKFSVVNAQTEASPDGKKGPVQQVTWLLRTILPAAPSLVELVAKHRPELLASWKANVTTAFPPPRAGVPPRQGFQVLEGEPVGIYTLQGTSGAIIFRRPYKAAQNVYTSLVLPTVYLDPNISSVSNSIALPMSRHMGVGYIPGNTGTSIYWNDMNRLGQNATVLPTKDSIFNELNATLKNNADLGLGGALGSLFDWIGSKVAKKHPKAGAIVDTVGGVLDGVLGMTRFGGLNNELGMLVAKKK